MFLGCVTSLWVMVRVIRGLLLLGKGPVLVIRLELHPLGAGPSAYGLCGYEHGVEGAEAVQMAVMVPTRDRGSWDEPRTT